MRRIASHHASTELGEFLRLLRWAGVMRLDAAVLRCEAKGRGNVEIVERPHLPIEPAVGVGTEAVRPAQAGAYLAHAEPLQPTHGIVEAVVFEVEPLADAQRRGVARDCRTACFGVPSSRSSPM